MDDWAGERADHLIDLFYTGCTCSLTGICSFCLDARAIEELRNKARAFDAIEQDRLAVNSKREGRWAVWSLDGDPFVADDLLTAIQQATEQSNG